MMLYTYTIAYADMNEYVGDWLSFTYDTVNTLAGYDGSEEQFNSYLQNTAQAAKYGLAVQALERINNDHLADLGIPRVPMNVVFSGTLDPTLEKYDGKFRAMVANRDYINSLYTLTNGSGENNRYKGLSEYGLTITGDYNVNTNITSVGTPTIAQNGNVLSSYLDLTSARQYSGLSFFSGTNYPPCVWVPSNGTGELYQNGVKLRSNRLYYLIGNNLCLGSYGDISFNYFLYYINHYDKNDFNKMQLNFKASNNITYSDETGYYTVQVPATTQHMYRYVNGATNPAGTTLSDELNLEILSQFEKSIGVNISFDNDVTIPVPDNIPYDNNDNVIIMYPTTNNNDYTYQTIKYMSPATYKNYIDNGKATYNNYTYNDDNTVVNNIINNYYEYIDSDSGSGGGSFDDSRIVGRLDTIIGKLNDIIDTIKNISTSDVPGVKIFSSTPIYTDFGDCVTDNVPIAGDIDKIYDGIDTTQSESVGNYIDRFKGEFADTDTPYTQLFDGITVNTNWYEPYRMRVRNILKIPCWVFAILGSWTVIKSVFGVKE